MEVVAIVLIRLLKTANNDPITDRTSIEALDAYSTRREREKLQECLTILALLLVEQLYQRDHLDFFLFYAGYLNNSYSCTAAVYMA